jgi:hypothetical protein
VTPTASLEESFYFQGGIPMDILANGIGFWLATSVDLFIFSTALALLVSILLFVFRLNKNNYFWKILVTVWFLAYSYKIFELIAGQIFLRTSNPIGSLIVGIIIALFPAVTPLIMFKLLKTNRAKWIYSILIIIIFGYAIQIAQAIASLSFNSFLTHDNNYYKISYITDKPKKEFIFMDFPIGASQQRIEKMVGITNMYKKKLSSKKNDIAKAFKAKKWIIYEQGQYVIWEQLSNKRFTSASTTTLAFDKNKLREIAVYWTLKSIDEAELLYYLTLGEAEDSYGKFTEGIKTGDILKSHSKSVLSPNVLNVILRNFQGIYLVKYSAISSR